MASYAGNIQKKLNATEADLDIVINQNVEIKSKMGKLEGDLNEKERQIKSQTADLTIKAQELQKANTLLKEVKTIYDVRNVKRREQTKVSKIKRLESDLFDKSLDIVEMAEILETREQELKAC
jgi:chromosome segregation ATPase